MTSENITERRNHLADLKVIRSAVEEAIKQVEKEIEGMESPNYLPGQIWKHAEKKELLISYDGERYFFTSLSSGHSYTIYAFEKHSLTYVGESIEVLKVGKE